MVAIFAKKNLHSIRSTHLTCSYKVHQINKSVHSFWCFHSYENCKKNIIKLSSSLFFVWRMKINKFIFFPSHQALWRERKSHVICGVFFWLINHHCFQCWWLFSPLWCADKTQSTTHTILDNNKNNENNENNEKQKEGELKKVVSLEMKWNTKQNTEKFVILQREICIIWSWWRLWN